MLHIGVVLAIIRTNAVQEHQLSSSMVLNALKSIITNIHIALNRFISVAKHNIWLFELFSMCLCQLQK